MKKSLKICLITLIIVIIFSLVIIFLFKNIKVKSSLNNHDNSSSEVYKNENIMSFLKEKNAIKSDDIYMGYDRDIGIFGPEGNKKYVYKRSSETYYYIEIMELSYTVEGNYLGYSYKPNEIFYRLDIQDCTYNESAEYMDNVILEEVGVITSYIVSEQNGNLELTNILP